MIMRNIQIGMLIALVVVGSTGSDARCQGDEKRTLKHGERERTYILRLPKELPKDKPVPLVIYFHGGSEKREYPTRSGKFGELADRERFIFVMPHAVGGHWNDGRETDFESFHEKVDDAGFVAAMIAQIEKQYRIDPKRIFAVGISNGGVCSHYIAAQMAEKIAAIAPVSGGMPDPFHQRFKPKEPVSVLIIQGTKDPGASYKGGKVPDAKGLNRGRMLGADDTVRMWVDHNGCRKEPATEQLPDTDPKDGCTVTRFTWPKGRNGTEVVLYKIDGGGHRWPGKDPPVVLSASQAQPEVLTARLGARCLDFDANEVIWEFFKRHPKP
jgi:polyhydroxybutyrate depolymerase